MVNLIEIDVVVNCVEETLSVHCAKKFLASVLLLRYFNLLQTIAHLPVRLKGLWLPQQEQILKFNKQAAINYGRFLHCVHYNI